MGTVLFFGILNKDDFFLLTKIEPSPFLFPLSFWWCCLQLSDVILCSLKIAPSSHMQSLDTLYKKHLETKTQWMVALLNGIGLSYLCSKIIPSPFSDGFRNRAKFRVFHGINGMRIEGTDPIDGSVAFEKSLWILPDWSKKIVRNVVAFIQKDHKDFVVDGFEVQLAHGKKNVHTTFSVKRSVTHSYEDLALALLTNIPEIVGVAIPSQKLEVGDIHLDHSIGGKDFCAHYASFFQSNLHLTPQLLENVSQICKKIAFREILDLYCGVGLLSLSVSEKDTKIIGIDTNRMAVESAQKNADRMDFRSAKFSVSSVDRSLRATEIGTNSLVLVNPPRSGCPSTVINAIVSQNPHHVLLVSCSLKTHVSDLAEWKKSGYEVLSFKAFDMFPFTDFLETVTVLKRKG
jgi:tRNA/tmRNA/rRNA uracil-C5-methylase (TrmA/RlmC/RlmD family)